MIIASPIGTALIPTHGSWRPLTEIFVFFPFLSMVSIKWYPYWVSTGPIISPGFAVDCLETLEEIKIQYHKLFINNGGNKKLFNILNYKQLSDLKKRKFCDHSVVNEKDFKIFHEI